MKVFKKIVIAVVSVLILGTIALGANYIINQKQELFAKEQEISQLHKEAKKVKTFKPGDKFNMQFESGTIYQCKVADGYPDCHIKGMEE